MVGQLVSTLHKYAWQICLFRMHAALLGACNVTCGERQYTEYIPLACAGGDAHGLFCQPTSSHH